MAGVAPDARANEVRVPWDRCEHGDLPLLPTCPSGQRCATTYGYQKANLEDIEGGGERAVQQRKQHGGRDGVFRMAASSCQSQSQSSPASTGRHVHKRIVKAHNGDGGDLVG
jgi:hypothetical protein